MKSNNLTDKQLNYMMDLIDQSIELTAKLGDDRSEAIAILTKLAICQDILRRDAEKVEKEREKAG